MLQNRRSYQYINVQTHGQSNESCIVNERVLETAVSLDKEGNRTEYCRKHGHMRCRMWRVHGAARGRRRGGGIRAILRNRERLECGEVLRAVGDRVRGEDHALTAVRQLPTVRPYRICL